jgi:GT2 family glycosyltransferase
MDINDPCQPRVYIIIVNYRNWTDTIECLESVLRNDYPNYQIVVVDNSGDEESIRNLKAWADGQLTSLFLNPGKLEHLSHPPIHKPVPYTIYHYKIGEVLREEVSSRSITSAVAGKIQLVIIHAEENLGFAGGNNTGIGYALSLGDCDFILLLNNDTVVESNFVFPLVQSYESQCNAGLVGGLIKFYDKSDEVWFSSGKFDWYKEGVHSIEIAKDTDIVKSGFVSGCLMMIPRDIINNVGLLSEEYFLYGEDTDYSLRVMRAGYQNFVNQRCVIYHKVSMATGGRFSKVMYYYSTRNRLYFHYKYYGKLDFFLFALFFLSSKAVRMLQFLLSGNKEALCSLLGGIVDFFKMKKRPAHE